ncbi:MAG: HypC/HybG/HupF family hydrogenase formation chaperone [Desulfobacteraceae bacterium]|nr:HypC/HybG/HupF family hydrogenase formation chaperone [Desulfobacteraceae bacterium]
MCLAVPMKVLHIEENTARVEIGGVRRTVRLDVIDHHPAVGDYVIVHAGFAIHLIEEKEATITLAYFKELLSCDTDASE